MRRPSEPYRSISDDPGIRLLVANALRKPGAPVITSSPRQRKVEQK